jgi:hypothetical protein
LLQNEECWPNCSRKEKEKGKKKKKKKKEEEEEEEAISLMLLFALSSWFAVCAGFSSQWAMCSDMHASRPKFRESPRTGPL